MTQAVENVTFPLGGAQVTMPVKAIAKAFLDSIASPPSVALPNRPPLAAGELYAGLIIGKDGAPDHHLILLPGAVEDKTWEQAKEWAASIGGELPTRREQSLLFANLKEQFEGTWYWSSEQSASNSYAAWYQTFDGGIQHYGHKGNELRARAVRRLIL